MSSVIENTAAFAPASGRTKLPANRMTGRKGALALLMAAGLMSGCASYSRDHVIVGSVPDDYRTRHPIIVSQNEVKEDIVVSVDARKLSRRDTDSVESFAMQFKRSGASSLAILIPSGSPNEAAARKLAHEAALLLQYNDIDASRLIIQHYQASGHGEAATLRLVYSDLVAKLASQCGQWDEDIAETKENYNYSNFGCATQQNLASMIANPADLLGPRGITSIDSTRRTKVINDWRDEGTGSLPTLLNY